MIVGAEIGDRLVAEWRAGGDRDAITRQLFDEYYPAIFSLFTRCGFAREDSMDLAQDTFVRAFAALDGFRYEGKFKSWLLRIADNVKANAFRAHKAAKRNAPEVSIEELVEERVSVASSPAGWRTEPPGPLEQLVVEERAELLYREIGRLPPQIRRCLLLRLGQQLKYDEIAKVLGIATGTVKAHLFQARQKLRDALGYLDSAVEEQEGE